MLDLFAIANENAGAVQAAFDSSVAGMPKPQAALVREFATWVELEALISINVKLFVIVELLTEGPYQNIYEWAQEQSRLSGRAAEDALRERLQRHYEKRVAFDRAFINGEKFRYGALNAGGVGLSSEYDPYCLVLSPAFQASLENAACLPGDSLKICFAADGSLDLSAVERSTAPHTHRHFLVAKERANELPGLDKREWPSVLISPGRYFEVIFIGAIFLDAIQCIRLAKAEHDRMWDLAFASFGRKLGDAERALVQDFVQLCRAVVDSRVQLEILG